MEKKEQLAPPSEPIRLDMRIKRGSRRFFAFLLCASFLTAAFAVSYAWVKRGNPDFFGKTESAQEADRGDSTVGSEDSSSVESAENHIQKETEEIPEGAIAIVTKDLSARQYHESYIHNETVYRPDVDSLRRQSTAGEEILFDPDDGPVVLIIHTHTTEAYASAGVPYLTGSLGEVSYSLDASKNVTAVGDVLCDTLNKNGVPAILCDRNHGENGSLQNSYANSAACIRSHLLRYPSIQYVIDVHRDGILTEEGACVRTLAQGTEKPIAQVMAIVGSDCNGTEHPAWQSNLSLALRLNDRLEEYSPTLARPVSLRNASYNQELVPNALLLEFGSIGNTVEEAGRAAVLVGAALAALITNR